MLRLRRDGLRRLAQAGEEPGIELSLRSRRGRLTGSNAAQAKPSCRSGATLATSATTRVFRLQGFGLYVCSSLARTTAPLNITTEDLGPFGAMATNVTTAGPYIAYTFLGGGKCPTGVVTRFDVRNQEDMRRHQSRNAVDGPANGCTGTSKIVRLVLQASGAIAWTEAAGNDGQVAVRAVDAAGQEVTLDREGDIDATSLLLADAHAVTWRRGAAVITAPLT